MDIRYGGQLQHVVLAATVDLTFLRAQVRRLGARSDGMDDQLQHRFATKTSMHLEWIPGSR